jgi:nucleotide-binding universal stress UspA family protein
MAPPLRVRAAQSSRGPGPEPRVLRGRRSRIRTAARRWTNGSLARWLRLRLGMSNLQSQVVVGYDFSHSGSAALYRAIALAARSPSHVLHFACIVDRHTPLPGHEHHGRVDYDYTERIQQDLTDVIAQELRAATTAGRVQFFVHVRIGKPAEELLALARDVGADLIIVGSKGLTGVERLVLGSVSEKVVREARCPVEVARPKSYDYVALTEIVEVEPHHGYVPPHRYSYEDHRLVLRPAEWPLY